MMRLAHIGILAAVLLVLLPSYARTAHAADLSFTVNASEAVTVDTAGGRTCPALDIGGVTREATYAKSYTIQQLPQGRSSSF